LKVLVTDRTGQRHELDAPADTVLMETLRQPDYGVAAICGGVMSCGTCHVYVAEQHLARLPSQSPDEVALLDAFLNVKPNSRLSCQIHMTAALEGLEVTIAPEE
jgi:2Fe-2S ferredoxin